MDIAQALVTGVVQGLTEFLPVSSSGHLVLTSSIYKVITGQALGSGGNEEVFFDIMLHVGTLVAVLVYFRQDLVNLFKAFFNALKNKSFKGNPEAQLPLYIMIGTIATIAVVYPLKDYFEADMHRPAVVGIQILITGLLLFATEFMSERMSKKLKSLDWKRSILIGIAQGLAVSPGISRSGSTIAAGLAAGMDRVSAARYSFLLSIPIIVLAALYDSLDLFKGNVALGYNWTAIIIGTIVSGIVGYYCIKYFIQFLSNHKLNGFALYCCIVGIAMYVYFTFMV